MTILIWEAFLIILPLGVAGAAWKNGCAPKYAMGWLAERSYASASGTAAMYRVSRALKALYGEERMQEKLHALIREGLLHSYAVLLGCNTAAIALNGDAALSWIGLFIAILLPAVKIRRLFTLEKRRTIQIRLELPIVLSKIILLLNAGETLQRSMRTAAMPTGKQRHPLYREFIVLFVQLENRMSFPQALEQFNRRCAVQEVSLFANALLMNYRRGGDELADALRMLSGQLWSERKTLARILGEEASSKLVIPMAVIFFIVIVLVAAPAMMHMGVS